MSISILNRGASGGLKPELTVTAPSGSTVDLLQNGIIVATYTLGASETEHTFMVKVGTYAVRGTLGTQTKDVDVVIDTVGQYSVEIEYRLYLYREGDECADVTGGWIDWSASSNWAIGFATKNSLTDILAKHTKAFFEYKIAKITSGHYYFGFEGGSGYNRQNQKQATNVVVGELEYGTNIANGQLRISIGMNTNGAITLTRTKLDNALYIYKSQQSNAQYADLYVYNIWLE